MSLNEEQIRRVAKLSSLTLSEEEFKKIQTNLNDIIDYVAKLEELDTRGIEPTSHVHGLVNNFRDDIVKESLSPETAVENASEKTPAGFKVPRII